MAKWAIVADRHAVAGSQRIVVHGPAGGDGVTSNQSKPLVEATVFLSLALALTLSAPAKDDPFPLRTDPVPKEWRLDEINMGLPYRWEKGEVHVLAWEVVSDDLPSKRTQVLVLKRFDDPPERGRWVLAQLYPTGDKERPWDRQIIILAPALPGQPFVRPPDAFVFGYEFYEQPPTDDEMKTFLKESMWTPKLDGELVFFMDGPTRTITPKVTAGGVDRATWKRALKREVSPHLFPELKRPSALKK
jgi:hypothetical protein